MTEKQLKVSVAARVSPELKEMILEQAQDLGMTPSKYIELLLSEKTNDDVQESDVELIEDLEVELEIDADDVDAEDINDEAIEELIEDKETLTHNDILEKENQLLRKSLCEQLENQLQKTKQLNEDQARLLDEITKERDDYADSFNSLKELSVSFTKEDWTEINEHLELLKKDYPSLSTRQFFMAGICIARYSEGSFFAKTVKDYIKHKEIDA